MTTFETEPPVVSTPATSRATTQADARQARLAAAVASIRRSEGFDVERAMHWAGSILFPTGIIVILLGWYGAAHTSYNFEQVPYLISGGILGAAMTIVGGFLYFGYWIARLVQESRRERTELAELLTRLDNRLASIEAVAVGTLPGADAAGGQARAQAASSVPVARNGRTAPVTLVATATGTLVHRPDCPLVAGKTGLRSVDPDQPGLKPCKVCDPLGDGADDEPAAPAAARRQRPLRA